MGFYKRKLYYELEVPRINIQPSSGSSQFFFST